MRRIAFILGSMLLWVSVASAHPLAPALLELQMDANGETQILWRTSKLRVPGSSIEPILPESCSVEGLPTQSEGADTIETRFRARCGALVGETVGVEGLRAARTDALVRIGFADGRQVQRVVRAANPSFQIPAADRRIDVARSYGILGVEHILSGLDHLLFVFGLLLLVSGVGTLIRTVTSFTVGHSITLSLVALDLLSFSTAWVEVAIALSVFYLAVELTRPREKSSLRRYPWAMAGLFGLLHGMGFAGALREAGLPQTEIPMALLSFNVGIEVGQLLFIAVALGLAAVWNRLPFTAPAWTRAVPLYAMGSLAAFWCLERLAAL